MMAASIKKRDLAFKWATKFDYVTDDLLGRLQHLEIKYFGKMQIEGVKLAGRNLEAMKALRTLIIIDEPWYYDKDVLDRDSKNFVTRYEKYFQDLGAKDPKRSVPKVILRMQRGDDLVSDEDDADEDDGNEGDWNEDDGDEDDPDEDE